MKPEAGSAALEGGKSVPYKTDMTARWTGPDDAERDIRLALRSLWLSCDNALEPRPMGIDYGSREIVGTFGPNTVIMRQSVFVRLRRPYMTKRGFRRWRARLKAQR